MNALPTTKLLASYWIPYVGIGKPEQRVTVPLTDIAKYVLANERQQTNVVFLGFATFTGTPQNFAPPYISIPLPRLPGSRQYRSVSFRPARPRLHHGIRI